MVGGFAKSPEICRIAIGGFFNPKSRYLAVSTVSPNAHGGFNRRYCL